MVVIPTTSLVAEFKRKRSSCFGVSAEVPAVAVDRQYKKDALNGYIMKIVTPQSAITIFAKVLLDIFGD